jgi:hypothetical protein
LTTVRLLKVLLIVVPFLVFVFVLRGLGESCRERGLPYGYGKIAQSERWRVYGPLGDEALARAGEELDAFRRLFHATYGEALHLRESDDALALYLFRDREAFREYANARLTDDTDRIAGYYWPGSWSVVAVVRRGLGLETFRHEIVHAILDRDVRGGGHAWSPWLNEGLAQAFEQPRVVGERLLPGEPRPEQALLVIAAYRGGFLPSVRDLSALDHDRFMADVDLHYAYAATLVLYLMNERWSDFVWFFDRERDAGPIAPSTLARRVGRDLRPELVAWLSSRASSPRDR